MRHTLRFFLPVMVAGCLYGCGDKPAGPTAAKPEAVQPAAAKATQPFVRAGELLSVHVDNMPREEFLAKLAGLTGTQVSADTDNSLPVSVNVDQASLRQVLGMAFADAPYTVTMQFGNLQDSFPASVVVSRYNSAGLAGMNTPPQAAAPAISREPAPMGGGSPIVAEEQQQPTEPEEPDFEAMSADEREGYFLNQNQDEQVSLVFQMEPTAEDTQLIDKMLTNDQVSKEVKMEMLDSLSNADYEQSVPALKTAMGAKDPDIAARAVEVLGELGSETDIPTLRSVAENHPDEKVKQAAKEAIEFLEP